MSQCTDSSTDQHVGFKGIKPKAPTKKIAENQSWNDIFAQSKIVVSMEPRNVDNPMVMIQHAQEDFLLNFGYKASDLPMPLAALFGKASIRVAVHRIQTAILTKKAACEYVNLYKANGIALSCHLSVISLTGGNCQTVPQTDDETPPTRPFRWAVITIRSASLVGNSKFSGIGLLGTERISQEKLNEKPGSSMSSTKTVVYKKK